MAVLRPYVMTPTEIVQGVVVGSEPAPPPTGSSESARQALEQVIVPTLTRQPCAVAFSGGRDSSLVLAIATQVARRLGLADPVPVTLVYPGDERADEHRWQEQVIRFLGLDDWQRVEINDELDLIGPVAQSHLTRHGVLWPPPIAVYLPLFEAARGGVLLDGGGGDEVVGDAIHRIAPLAYVVRHPRRSDRRTYRLALRAVAPSRLRDPSLTWFRDGAAPTWLTPSGSDVLMDALRASERNAPLSFSASVRRVPEQRHHRCLTRNLAVLARPFDVEVVSPLVSRRFVDAVAREGGWLGPGSRTDALRHMVPDLLPSDVIRRTSKAYFNSAYFHRYTREFAREWDGSGFDDHLVDAEALRRQLLEPAPHTLVGGLVQAAWLATTHER